MPRKLGPKTLAGRDAVSGNAVTHGIMTPTPVLRFVEDEAEWERHRAGTIESLQPENHVEAVLAERIANLLWRLKRVERYENEMTILGMNHIDKEAVNQKVMMAMAARQEEPDDITQEDMDDWVRRRIIADDWVLDKVRRYESHLHRQLVQTLHELEALQTRRQGGSTPLTRLDFSGPPTS